MSVAAVVGIWAYLLEIASKADPLGSIAGLDMDLAVYTLRLQSHTALETVCNGMKRAGIVTSNGEIAMWSARQAKRENQEPSGASTKRVQALRARQKANNGAGNDDFDSGNDSNASKRHETTRNDTKRHETTQKKKKKESRESKTLNPSSPDGDDGDPFDEFWEAYPLKVAKIEARKAWAKMKPDAELQAAILAAIEAQKQGHDWLKDDGMYIPNPASWLRAGRWLDVVRPFVERRTVDAWWASKEAMAKKGLSLDPPLTPRSGEYPNEFRARIEAALDPDGQPDRREAVATPYVPPEPANGLDDLTPDQRKARMADLKAVLQARKEAE